MMLGGDGIEPAWWWWRRLLGAGVIVTGLHAGVVAYAYLQPPPDEFLEEPEGAFMMELAALPVAAASEAAEPGPVAETTQPQVEEKKPTEETPEVTPPKEEVLPVAPAPELAMPIPKPVEEPKEEKEEDQPPVEKKEVKEENKDEKPELEQAKAQEAMVKAGGPPSPSSTPAPQTAARRQGTTDKRSNESASWAKTLMAHLGKHRRYPTAARQAGHQGAVQVRFTIDRGGHVLSAKVVRTSKSSHLDQEALAMLRRAAPLPEPPDEVRGEVVELVIPIQFTIR